MTFLPLSSLNFTHMRSISPQSELPTVPTASASGNSPMFWGLRRASAIFFCISSFIGLAKFISRQLGINFNGPGINATQQAADVFKPVPHEISGGVQRFASLVIHQDQGPGVGSFGQNLAHDRL